MQPEEQARLVIDEKLEQSGWTIQDMSKLNLTVSLGVAVREFPTNTGPVDYALFVEGKPVGVVEAKKTELGEKITTVEEQSSRYANSTFKWVQRDYEMEFLAYTPNDDPRNFSQLYGVRRLKDSYIPVDIQICVSTIQRMYSILKGEEFDEGTEEVPFEEYITAESKAPKEVVHNERYPPEFFDCIIVDECHRSIYNVWSQVLTYFDAFIIGLTATPNKRTFAFFDENVVSEYTREQAIVDGVNVGEDIFLIETDVTKNGARLMKQLIEYRDRLSRTMRWQQMDEDYSGAKRSKLDKDVVNPSLIRTVIRTFKENLFTSLFPNRKEVPKTLILAKTDSHADDIIQIVRKEFGEGNDFCKKMMYSVEKSETVLSAFRNDYYPRIAVTVDMIATGTDVKPIECLIFMRDVRSRNYFEQMKGRGTRTLTVDVLQKVTPSATENKDHFVLDIAGLWQKSITGYLKVKTSPRHLKRCCGLVLRSVFSARFFY